MSGIYARTEEALDVLKKCEEEMWKRIDKLKRARAQFRTPPKFPLFVVLIDEGGELSPKDAIGEEKVLRSKCMQRLSTLVRISREAGIRVIYGTQRTEGNTTLHVTIRGQPDNIICFRVREKGDSEIVLGHQGAEQLMVNPGRSIFQSCVTGVEFQGIYHDEDSPNEWLKTSVDNRPRLVVSGEDKCQLLFLFCVQSVCYLLRLVSHLPSGCSPQSNWRDSWTHRGIVIRCCVLVNSSQSILMALRRSQDRTGSLCEGVSRPKRNVSVVCSSSPSMA